MTAESLHDSPGLLATAIAEATDDVMFAKDVQGRYLFANPAMLKVLGASSEQVIGHTDAEFLGDPATARGMIEEDARVLSSGCAIDKEERIQMPDGSGRYFLTRKTPLRNATGAVIGLLGIARDVTERRAFEAQRDANRLKLEMGIQAAGLVMADIDYRSNLNHISAELARMLELGERARTVPRQAVFDRIHPEDRPRYLDAIERALDPAGNGHLAIDVRALLPSGVVRWLHIRLQVVFEEVEGRREPVRGICAAREVTTEMLAEQKMRAAQRLTQSVIEGAGALVYAKDLQGRYILSNQVWRAINRLTPEQAQGVTDEQLFGRETAQILRANDRQVAATGQPLAVQEATMLHGRRAIFHSSKFPLFDATGQIYAVCGVSTDITDVVEADRRKDEFIATLAHELRNPLAPLRTGLEILRRVGGLAPTAARTRDMMERQLTHMVRLVDDLLDVSRVSRGKLELRLETVSLEQVLNDAIEGCHPAIGAAGHSLQLQLPERPLLLRGDLTRLAQVFSNLVNNASKYTPPAGRIELRARQEGQQVVVEVADNGSGIGPGMLPHVFDLFDLFAQGGSSMQLSQSGLGIGLWLVKNLVELHGGSIDAASAGVGLGSTFTVRLPLAA